MQSINNNMVSREIIFTVLALKYFDKNATAKTPNFYNFFYDVTVTNQQLTS